MRRWGALVRALLLVLSMAVLCGAGQARAQVPETLTLALPAAGWQDTYLGFLESNFDVFAALWPEGVGGIGFIDLDLDGTPEMVMFDQGASAAMGAHIFDIADGQVCCVSSTHEGTAGAFGGTYLSAVDVCTGFFEAFRLSRTSAGWCFWVDSANGTMETAWDEIVRFDSANGVLSPTGVCSRYLEFDPYSGLVVTENYTVSGAVSDVGGYTAAAGIYQDGQDVGYDAAGVFLWDNFDLYSAGLDGFMAMARDAVSVYRPITDYVTLASLQP